MTESLHDTIAAVATAAGGGIGIVRISGPDAVAVAGRIFRSRQGRPLAAAPPFRLVLGEIVAPDGGARLDEVLAVRMPAGRSYTGEPVVELHGHGGRAVLDAVLRAALDAGARPAAPGEFTRRAFVSGRLDLAQAEAVAALVAAESERDRRDAMLQLQGSLGERFRPLRERLLDFACRVDAALDFDEDEVPADLPAADEVRELADGLRAQAARAADARAAGGGARVVIAGRPNAGKSSIFNYLVRKERAIVAALPGTTRDYVEERSVFGGVSVTVVDTAGFRQSADPVEAEGVRRSLHQIGDADVVVLVRDGSEPPHPDDERLIALTERRRPIVVVSKADRPRRDGGGDAWPRCGIDVFRVSTVTGEGCADFADELGARCRATLPEAATATAAPNVRHVNALERAAGHLEDAAAARGAGGQLDLVALGLRAAVDALGEITGETATDEILDRIFSRFCIGK